jgi:hypothetical protein
MWNHNISCNAPGGLKGGGGRAWAEGRYAKREEILADEGLGARRSLLGSRWFQRKAGEV